MRLSFFYIIILFLYFSGDILGQETHAKDWNSNKEIYERLNYHRKHRNYDSSIYYADELIRFESAKQSVEVFNGANFQKIETYQLFNKPGEAYRLTLALQEKYCDPPPDKNCGNCNRIYRKLSDLMVVVEDYRQGLLYLDQICNGSRDSKVQYEKAKLYTLLKLNDSALTLTEENVKFQLDNGSPYARISAYNTHGLIAKNIENYDEAILAFRSCIDVIDSTNNNKHMKPTVQGNLGSCYFLKGDLDVALNYLELDSEGSLKLGEVGSYINAEMTIAEIEIIRKDYEKAIKRLEYLLKSNERSLIYMQKEGIFNLLRTANKAIGNNDKFNHYTNAWYELNNEEYRNKSIEHQVIVQQFSSNLLRQATKQMETEKQLMDQKVLVLEKEEEKNRFRNWLLGIGLGLVILIILFFFWRYRLIQTKKTFVKEAQLKLVKKEQELVISELKYKKKDLNNLVTNLTYKRKFINEVQDKLKELQKQPEELSENITLLIREFNSYKNADKNTEVLQADIDKVNLSFFNKLGDKFPLLTENEKELCGLFLMKLSSKDIANIRNVTPNAIKKARQRIRKKLPILESEKLTPFLEKV